MAQTVSGASGADFDVPSVRIYQTGVTGKHPLFSTQNAADEGRRLRGCLRKGALEGRVSLSFAGSHPWLDTLSPYVPGRELYASHQTSKAIQATHSSATSAHGAEPLDKSRVA